MMYYQIPADERSHGNQSRFLKDSSWYQWLILIESHYTSNYIFLSEFEAYIGIKENVFRYLREVDKLSPKSALDFKLKPNAAITCSH